MQRKITDSLATLPKNRQILLLREEERERLILLQEAKKEIWKRWRQRKGRGMKMNEIKQKDSAEDMERKLRRIEAEVERYHQELQTKELELKANKDRKKRKEQKEKQWEMMRWLVSYIETNKEAWEKRRQEEIREREQQEAEEEWRLLTKEQRIEKLKGEEAEVRKNLKLGKEERLETVRKLKSIWKKREEEEEQKPDGGEATPEEEAAEVRELEYQKLLESGELLE